MDPLSGVSSVMEVLRRQMSENLERLRRTDGATAGRRALPRISGKPVAPTLRQTLVTRIRGLDAQDPQYQRRATAVFVETILGAEFGDAIQNDPEFRLVAREVAEAMSANTKVADDLAVLFAELAS